MNVNISENNVISRDVIIVQKTNLTEEIKNKKLFYKICKRLIDIFIGTIGVLLLIPITVCVYFLKVLKKENDGPLFYEQLRIGKNGKEFRIYKYRTMVMNADEKLAQYLEENEEAKKEYERYKKLKNDPRITRLGRILRNTSIDEFPQFINVLKGDMSVVGPRPYLHREIKDMEDNYKTIISVKPGITGYWQVNGRNAKSFKERINMDVAYIKDRTLWFDIKIIIKTILKIFRKEGAM